MEGEQQPNGDVVVTLPTPKVPDQQPTAQAPAVTTPEPTVPGDATPDALSLEEKPDPATVIDDGVVYDYTSTGDASFDLALSFVGQRGIAPEHPAMAAAFKGDFSPLEAVLKNMGDKAQGYQGYLAAAKDAYARTSEKGSATVAAVHSAVGGAEQWATIQAWAAKNAEPAEKKYINECFRLGGNFAVKAANELAAAYAANNGKAAPASALKDGAGGASGASVAAEPLSPEAYTKAVADLVAKNGLQATRSKEYIELTERRKAYKGA